MENMFSSCRCGHATWEGTVPEQRSPQKSSVTYSAVWIRAAGRKKAGPRGEFTNVPLNGTKSSIVKSSSHGPSHTVQDLL